jgi:hypothetical protein
MANEKKHYACPNCNTKLPLKRIFLLNNNSEVTCDKCGYVARPEKMGMWYIGTTFFAVVIPGQIVLWQKGSFIEAVAIGLSVGVVVYGAILVYVYNKVKFY